MFSLLRFRAAVMSGALLLLSLPVALSADCNSDPEVELRIEMNDDRDQVAPGEELSYSVEVTNSASASAEGVRVDLTLDEDLRLVRFQGVEACIGGGSFYTCDLGVLEPMDTLRFTVVTELSEDATGAGSGGDTCSSDSDICTQVAIVSPCLQENYDDDMTSEATGISAQPPEARLVLDMSPDVLCQDEESDVRLQLLCREHRKRKRVGCGGPRRPVWRGRPDPGR